MNKGTVKALETKVKQKTGMGAPEAPMILIQDDETGLWYDFSEWASHDPENPPAPKDPRVRWLGGNHYLCGTMHDKENEELLKYVQEHKLSFHRNAHEFPNSW